MTVLVTGGAGYIGSHVVRTLQAANRDVISVDLTTGFDVTDMPRLAWLMRDEGVKSVIHLAGFKHAAESVARPEHTLWRNTAGTLSVLAAAAETGVQTVVFSSSAAVYGTPDGPATEDTPAAPESPYGLSKLLAEQACAASHIRTVRLRYFNVAGSGWSDLPDISAHNLFPRLCADLANGYMPEVYGADYPTIDGTAVRDYVHVSDIAQAHIAALDAPAGVYNLGSGVGHSVQEVLDEFAAVTGLDTTPLVLPRRPGDPAQILANIDQARRVLGWEPRHTLTDMVASAWEASK